MAYLSPNVVAHRTTHEVGGSDEIDVTNLSGLLADPQTPLPHAATHQVGGADEINVTGLSGILADAQPPALHAVDHEVGGADEVSIAGLVGESVEMAAHRGVESQPIHGSTVVATAEKLVHRDAAGRARIANPAVDADIDNQGSRNTAIETHRTGATHALDQPPADHDNTKHTTDYAPLADFNNHDARHAWLGADELNLTNLLAAREQLLTVDWQTADMWTEVNVGGAYQTITIWRLSLITSAVVGDIAKRHTTGNAIPPHDGLPIAYTFLVQNWGIAQSDSVIWLGLFRNTTTPANTAIHVGFKIIDGLIYATSSDGVAQEITNTGDSALDANAWRQKRLSFMCDTAGQMKYYIGDSLKATHTTRLPGRWTSTGQFILQLENTDNIAQSFAIRAIYGAGRPIMG